MARTLVDLAEVLERRGLERALDQAEVLELFDLRALEAVLERTRMRAGARVLRTVLTEHRLGHSRWRVIRVTWRQVTREPAVLAQTIRSLLLQARDQPAQR